jgi:hypothetical protein
LLMRLPMAARPGKQNDVRFSKQPARRPLALNVLSNQTPGTRGKGFLIPYPWSLNKT